MGQIYLQRFEYRGAVDKAAFDSAWTVANETFARTGNWGGVEKGIKHVQAYGTANGGYVLLDVDDPAALDEYQLFHTNNYAHMARITFEPVTDQSPHDPARRYRFCDGRGEIGIIATVTQPFCSTCDRVRLTADGKLVTCLFDQVEGDLLGELRSGANDEQLADAIRRTILKKPPGYVGLQNSVVGMRRPISTLGG